MSTGFRYLSGSWIRLWYQKTCFIFSEMTQRLAEKKGRGGGQRGGWPGPNKSNNLKIEGLSDICLSLFFRDDIFFSRYYPKYTIYNKTTMNISLLIPLWKSVDMSQLKRHKEKNNFYYFSNILCHSHTCSNNHLCKTTTRLRRTMLSVPKQIPKQSLLCKTTTCLTWSATTFLVSKWNLYKTCIKLPL